MFFFVSKACLNAYFCYVLQDMTKVQGRPAKWDINMHDSLPIMPTSAVSHNSLMSTWLLFSLQAVLF